MKKIVYILLFSVFVSCDRDEEINLNLPLNPPNLIFPLHETECSNVIMTFMWEASNIQLGNTIEYTLIISTSSTFENNVETYTTTNTEYDVNLDNGTAYYWKVEVSNGTDSVESEGRSLYTQGGDGVTNTAPQIEYISPNDEVTITGSSLSLEWAASDNETSNTDLSYKIYFSEVGQDLEVIHVDAGIDNYLIENLNSNTTYQWSVWVTDTDGATNVGEVRTFSVQ